MLDVQKMLILREWNLYYLIINIENIKCLFEIAQRLYSVQFLYIEKQVVYTVQ